jgi:hypothetical protein
MRVKLSDDEATYLSTASFLTADFRDKLKHARRPVPSCVAVELSPDEADSIRDALGEELQRAGFDEGYNVNAIGRLIERLIDEFYLP